MKLQKKIQKIPLKVRRVILYLVTICLGAVLIWYWIQYSLNNFKGFEKDNTLEDFNVPELKEKIKKDIPELGIPGEMQNTENSQ